MSEHLIGDEDAGVSAVIDPNVGHASMRQGCVALAMLMSDLAVASALATASGGALLLYAYCSHGAVVAPSVDEGKSEPDCRRGDEADAVADCSPERPLAPRQLAPRRRGVALGASRSADSGTIRSYAAGAQQSQRAPNRR